MTGCPACHAPQDQGLLCASCTGRLVTDLRGDADVMGVAELVDNLHVAMAKQARIGSSSSSRARPRPLVAEDEDGDHKLAHERLPINLGAAAALADLEFYLGTWAKDVTGETWWPGPGEQPAVSAAGALLGDMRAIRRHGAAGELVEEVTKSIGRARRIIDRPIDLRYIGPCLADTADGRCGEDLYAGPVAEHVRCHRCGTRHDVVERRAYLMESAADYIVSVREASRYIGFFGGVGVGQKTIRTWIDRGLLATRPGRTDERHIRVGDLLSLLADRAGKGRRKTRDAA